jgi:hypothetical protein
VPVQRVGDALCGGLLATVSPFDGDGGLPDLAPRLVEGEVTEQRCGFPPLDLVVLVAPAVGLGGEISGGGCGGGHIVGWLSVF